MALLLVLTVSTGASFCQPVAAADTSVNSGMSNDEIQSVLDTAGAGDTITFLSGIYSNVVLTVSTALDLVGNDAILNSAGNSTIFTIVGTAASGTNVTGFTFNGSGSNMAINATNTVGIDIENNVFNNNKRAIYFSNVNNSSIQSNDIYNNTEFGLYISDTGNLISLNDLLIDGNRLINSTGGMSIGGSGFSIVNNYIDMYNSTSVGISGGAVYNTLIKNNTISNGGDAINLAGTVLNYTIDSNTINNMTRRYGDGISIMNHDNTTVYDSITNNVVNNAFYGMFLGGYFTGNISGNVINNTGTAAVNFTQKMGPGNLNLSFTNNTITNAGNIGIAIEVPATYLDMENNTINSSRFSIEYNQNYKNNGQVIIGDSNVINNTQNFKVASTMNNDYIQSIIDGANAGDTITFLAGTYSNMTFTITKALNLVGNSAILSSNSTILNIAGSAASGTNVTGLKFNGNGSNIAINVTDTDGINIANNVFNNTKRAVYFSNVNDSSIVSNNITNNTEYGIYISDTGNFSTNMNNMLIDNNRLVNSSGGIHANGYGFTITNNYVDNNNNRNYNAIDSSNLWTAMIQNNTLLNGADGVNIFGTGINITVDSNYINNMKGSYGDGISIITHTQIGTSSITNNVVNNTNYGIWEGGFVGTISGNILNNSAITAMNLTSKMGSGSLNATIVNNSIINSPNIGIAIEVPVTHLNLDDNNITSDRFNIEYGTNYRANGDVIIGDGNIMSNGQNFKVASTMNNTYIQSIIDSANSGDTVTFLAGTYSNIALTITKAINMVGNGAILSNNGTSSTITVTGTGASGTNITNFTINGAADNGINLNSVENVSIKNNNITGNNNGVAISDSDNNVVSGNNITSNGENGVSVKSSSKNQVKDNTISKNGGHGVSLNNSDNSTVTDNEISENEGDGVNEDTSSDNRVEDNNIHANSGNGVSLTDSDNNTVTGNEVYDNVERGVSSNNSNNNTLSNNVYSNGITVNVSSVDPVNGAYINTSKNITVNFSDPIQRGSGLIKLLKNGTSVAFTTSINDNVLTIIPTSALTNGTYQVILYNGSITDLMGNPVVLSSTSFTMDNAKPTATVNPVGGTYTTSKSVTLAMSKNGTIYYTIDGTTPTTSSTKYTGPITISKTTTLKYLALDEAGNLSDVYTQLYTINTATPKVTKTSPTNGATGVLLSSAIYIKFSENIKSSTKFSGIIIKNMTTGKVVTNYTKTISGNTLKLKMSSNRLKNCVYKIYIPAKAVKNSVGSNLATSYSFTFTTKAK